MKRQLIIIAAIAVFGAPTASLALGWSDLDPTQITRPVGKAVETTAQNVGHAAENAAHDIGNTAQTAAQDAGHSIENAAHDVGYAGTEVGNYVGEHPWETVAAVALVAGGAYLIAYEGYALSVSVEGVQVLSVTSGTTSGVIAGSSMAATGLGGTAFYASMNTGAGAAVSPQTANVPTGAGQSATDKIIARSAANGLTSLQAADGANQQSVLYWPHLPEHPTAWDRMDYADSVSTWAEHVDPIERFNPSEVPDLTAAEIKLLDALTGLYAIPDTEGSIAAKKQAEEMRHEVLSFAGDQAKDKLIEKVLEQTLGHMAAQVFSGYGNVTGVFSGRVISDDAIDRRDSLKKQLANQLRAYQAMREAQAPRHEWSWLEGLLKANNGQEVKPATP